mmetsp:Transcript_11531/g.24890  ORF Transcript_11531/g.24890 Transcript_11531/m.24890 type:complete len:84 (-) Transcript_11531:1444-1695(-)
MPERLLEEIELRSFSFLNVDTAAEGVHYFANFGGNADHVVGVLGRALVQLALVVGDFGVGELEAVSGRNHDGAIIRRDYILFS